MGIKTRKEVNEYFSGDFIKCLICDKNFKSLGTHIRVMHDYTVDEYKKEFNLPWGKGLVGKRTKERYRENMTNRVKTNKRLQTTPEQTKKAQQAKKRKHKKYNIQRLKKMRKTVTAVHKHNRVEKTQVILDTLEQTGFAIAKICKLFDINMSIFYARLNESPKCKNRYENIKNKLKKERDRKIKRIPKADSFGDKEDWQTSFKFRKEVYAETQKINFHIMEEDIDELVVVLNKLGYTKFRINS